MDNLATTLGKRIAASEVTGGDRAKCEVSTSPHGEVADGRIARMPSGRSAERSDR